MKILFKVIVLVIVLVSCIYLWKMFNGLHITKAQFAISYGLAILAGGLFVGWLTDFDFNNQSLYDNREADPLSDWVKIQDRAKGRNDFWKGLISDSDMDERLQWEMNLLDCESGFETRLPAKPKNTFRPMLVVDEAHKGNAETIKRIAEEVETELRQPYEPYAGCWIEQEKELGRIVTTQQKEDKLYNMPADDANKERLTYNQVSGRINRNIPAWLFDEAGDAVNPLDHEQSK